MGTRGFVGVVVDGTEKIGYVHSDAYPEGVGLDTLTWTWRAVADIPSLVTAARSLRVVDSRTAPTADDVSRLRRWTDLTVGERSAFSWYCLLRTTQGRLGEILAAGVVEDASSFPMGLECQYGYLVDLDIGVFEAYANRWPGGGGRFVERGWSSAGSDPCGLVMSWQLDGLPDDDGFLTAFHVDPKEGP